MIESVDIPWVLSALGVIGWFIKTGVDKGRMMALLTALAERLEKLEATVHPAEYDDSLLTVASHEQMSRSCAMQLRTEMEGIYNKICGEITQIKSLIKQQSDANMADQIKEFTATMKQVQRHLTRND